MKISNELKNKYVCWGRNKEIRRRKVNLEEKKGENRPPSHEDFTYVRQILFLKNRKREKSSRVHAA